MARTHFAKQPTARKLVEPTIAERRAQPFVVAAMATPSHAAAAMRLAASCRLFDLPIAVYEVPSVHRSISPRGTDDPAYTKASFLSHVLDEYRCPVLYIDADCVVVEMPQLMAHVATSSDFAIYNWLADEHTEAYAPIDYPTVDARGQEVVIRNRFYRFSHRIDVLHHTQLICSGAVQLYAPTAPARALLESWQEAILFFPGVADDHCLDFAINNRLSDFPAISLQWLPKEYARIAWWIYARPVIDHPGLPYRGQGFVPLSDPLGRKQAYLDDARPSGVEPYFPTDCIIDTERRQLIRLAGNGRLAFTPFDRPLWLSRVD
jgi:hypothetical protein